MKKHHKTMIILLLAGLLITGSGCQAGGVKLSEDEIKETAAEQAFLDQAETAVFETQVVALLTEWAPTATLTMTPSPTFTLTPKPSLTPTITETVFKNPWVLQDVCLTEVPSPCIGYRVQNTTSDAWININLVHSLSGTEGFFSVPPKTTGTITLLAGEYSALYSANCGGVARGLKKVWFLNERTDALYCSTGLHELRFK